MMMKNIEIIYGNLATVPTWRSYSCVTTSSKEEFSSNWDGVIAVCRNTRRKARSNSPPADSGGVGSDLRWCKHHQSRNFYSVFCCRSCRYSPGGYDTELGRAPTVGDTSGDTNECCCVEAACGWKAGATLEETADCLYLRSGHRYLATIGPEKHCPKWRPQRSVKTQAELESAEKPAVNVAAALQYSVSKMAHKWNSAATYHTVNIVADHIKHTGSVHEMFEDQF